MTIHQKDNLSADYFPMKRQFINRLFSNEATIHQLTIFQLYSQNDSSSYDYFSTMFSKRPFINWLLSNYISKRQFINRLFFNYILQTTIQLFPNAFKEMFKTAHDTIEMHLFYKEHHKTQKTRDQSHFVHFVQKLWTKCDWFLVFLCFVMLFTKKMHFDGVMGCLKHFLESIGE